MTSSSLSICSTFLLTDVALKKLIRAVAADYRILYIDTLLSSCALNADILHVRQYLPDIMMLHTYVYPNDL